MPKSELVVSRSETLTNSIRPGRKNKTNKQKPYRIINTKKGKQNVIICRKHNRPSKNFKRIN